jgi:hypothetical protein
MKIKITSALFFLIGYALLAQHSIIPTPVNYISQKGSFVFTPKTEVYLISSNSELR